MAEGVGRKPMEQIAGAIEPADGIQLRCLHVGGDGSLVEHNSVTAALDKSEGRHLVLMARDQYAAGVETIGDRDQAIVKPLGNTQ